MNEATIIAVANAITANAEVLKSLIEHLSPADKQAVEAKVGKKTKDTPVAAPVATPAPMPAAPFPQAAVTTVPADAAPVTVPVVAAPVVPTPAPIPAAPVAVQTAPVAPAPVAASHSDTSAPFTDTAGLMNWMMAAYKEMGPTKGARLQECLNQIGVKAVNEVQPHHYSQLVHLVMALKASA